jgi:hypothetical protein
MRLPPHVASVGNDWPCVKVPSPHTSYSLQYEIGTHGVAPLQEVILRTYGATYWIDHEAEAQKVHVWRARFLTAEMTNFINEHEAKRPRRQAIQAESNC